MLIIVTDLAFHWHAWPVTGEMTSPSQAFRRAAALFKLSDKGITPASMHSMDSNMRTNLDIVLPSLVQGIVQACKDLLIVDARRWLHAEHGVNTMCPSSHRVEATLAGLSHLVPD